MQLSEMKRELERLRQENGQLHDMYVFFTVETPDCVYHLTMPADKFLEYIDRGIVFDKDGTLNMTSEEADVYHALLWQRFISDLKGNFNEFAKSDGIYRCEITAVHGLDTALAPEIALMGELVMAEYALAAYEDANPALQKLEQSVHEDYGDVLDGSTYHFTYTIAEAAGNIDSLKNTYGEGIQYENVDDGTGGVYSVEENDAEMERRYDADGD